MWVTVKLYGSLRRLSQEGTPGLWQSEIQPGTTIRDLILLLGTKEAEVAASAVDGKIHPFDREISDGMEITLVPHIGGG